jgi:glycosyltransferase involved in cell wall biosynthesis
VIKLSIVIPVFNNRESLKELYIRLAGQCIEQQWTYEIIFINDGSKDDSSNILKEVALLDPNVRIITLSRNYGQHPAICAGFEIAKGKFIVLMDADLQDSPEDLPLLINKIEGDGLDVLYTIRTPNSKNQSSRFTSKLYHFTFSKIVGVFVPNNIGTFRVFNQNFLKGILKFKEKDILYGPLMFYMGYKSDFIEIPYIESVNNKSNYTFFKRVRMACNSLISYTDIPLKLFLSFGFGFFSLSTTYLLIIVIQYFLKGAYLTDGATLIITLMSMWFGCMMVCMGIMGIYLFKVYQIVLNRPRYLIQETINYLDEKSNE